MSAQEERQSGADRRSPKNPAMQGSEKQRRSSQTKVCHCRKASRRASGEGEVVCVSRLAGASHFGVRPALCETGAVRACPPWRAALPLPERKGGSKHFSSSGHGFNRAAHVARRSSFLPRAFRASGSALTSLRAPEFLKTGRSVPVQPGRSFSLNSPSKTTPGPGSAKLIIKEG